VTGLFFIIFATRLSTARACAIAGALVGLCYLTEYGFWVMLIPLVFGAVVAKGEKGPAIFFPTVAGFLAVAADGGCGNIVVAGNPFIAARWWRDAYGLYYLWGLDDGAGGLSRLINVGERFRSFGRQVGDVLFVYQNYFGALFSLRRFGSSRTPDAGDAEMDVRDDSGGVAASRDRRRQLPIWLHAVHASCLRCRRRVRCRTL
jgi:hypothetical protein